MGGAGWDEVRGEETGGRGMRERRRDASRRVARRWEAHRDEKGPRRLQRGEMAPFHVEHWGACIDGGKRGGRRGGQVGREHVARLHARCEGFEPIDDAAARPSTIQGQLPGRRQRQVCKRRTASHLTLRVHDCAELLERCTRAGTSTGLRASVATSRSISDTAREALGHKPAHRWQAARELVRRDACTHGQHGRMASASARPERAHRQRENESPAWAHGARGRRHDLRCRVRTVRKCLDVVAKLAAESGDARVVADEPRVASVERLAEEEEHDGRVPRRTHEEAQVRHRGHALRRSARDQAERNTRGGSACTCS
jgi:hypothetical protein